MFQTVLNSRKRGKDRKLGISWLRFPVPGKGRVTILAVGAKSLQNYSKITSSELTGIGELRLRMI